MFEKCILPVSVLMCPLLCFLILILLFVPLFDGKKSLERKTRAVFLCCRSKYLTDDLYLEPYTCAELGFLYLDDGAFDMAKEYLERARCVEFLKSGVNPRIICMLQVRLNLQVNLFQPRSVCFKLSQLVLTQVSLGRVQNTGHCFTNTESILNIC